MTTHKPLLSHAFGNKNIIKYNRHIEKEPYEVDTFINIAPQSHITTFHCPNCASFCDKLIDFESYDELAVTEISCPTCKSKIKINCKIYNC